MAIIFPFTAIVGQSRMKQALILNAINPRIGGVLIRGERGTAKSTSVRALAALLPDILVVAGCPFGCDPTDEANLCDDCRARLRGGEVPLPTEYRRTRMVDLPVSATEDRVVGTLDIEAAIKRGEKRFEPGVLAAANRGVLYVDEVNLLDDHVVDLLLDAAAMGVNVVEREGISFTHPAQFVLVGTMNPEEGELRPQLLDRFGFWVEVGGIADSEQRMQILQRRIEFELDPEAFARKWQPEEKKLTQRLLAARQLLPRVSYSTDNLFVIAQLTGEMGVEGHRGDLTILKGAIAHAALNRRTQINDVDILVAAQLALPHRLKRRPLQGAEREMQALQERLEKAMQDAEGQEVQDDLSLEDMDGTQGKKKDETGEFDSDEGLSADTEPELQESPEARPQQVPDRSSETADDTKGKIGQVGSIFETQRIVTNLDRMTRRRAGKRSYTRTDRKRGRYIKAQPMRGKPSDVAFDATLRRAAPEQIHRQDDDLALSIRPDELQKKVRVRRTANLILFVVDASWSMAASERMEATKGAILSLLKDAYQKRDSVGLITFQKDRARTILPPTSSVDLAERALEEIPVGGKTPLSSGLYQALEVIEKEKRRNPDVRTLVVLLTDGAGNVSIGSTPPQQEAMQLARIFDERQHDSVVINTEHEAFDRGLAQALGDAMGAETFSLKEFSADALRSVVEERMR
jgi:magnesium chelatase subunit D